MGEVSLDTGEGQRKDRLGGRICGSLLHQILSRLGFRSLTWVSSSLHLSAILLAQTKKTQCRAGVLLGIREPWGLFGLMSTM